MSKRSGKRPKKRRDSASAAATNSADQGHLKTLLGIGLAFAITAAATTGVFYSLRDYSSNSKPSDGDSERNTNHRATVQTATAPTATVQTSVELPTVPGLTEQRFDAVVRGVAKREDPVVDGWDSERFNDLASVQLDVVGTMMSQPDHLDAARVAKVAAPSFASAGLRPTDLQTTFADKSLTVWRGELAPGAASQFNGHAGFVDLLRQQVEPLLGLSEVRFKYKIVRVDQHDDYTDTKAYFQISGRNEQQATQVNAIWDCRWLAGKDLDAPVLAGIAVRNYEEVVYRSPRGGSMFADCTESVFRNSDRFARQLVFGIDHWTDQFDGAIARPAAGHGVAVGDVNGDGLEDVYLCQPPALPNLLLIQDPDGTVRDTAVEAGVNWLEGSRAALLADLDNDGDQDLAVVLGSKVVIQANDGTGKFQTTAVVSTPSSLFAINAVDYDADRDLDLFICAYTFSSGVNLDDIFANPMPFHDANNGAPNVMLRNEGSWGFTDVTDAIGLSQNNMRFSYASAWDDFDSDGDLDVYVANDFGRNNLYRNDQGQFVDVAPQLGVEDIGPGMSAAWGDYNNDGHADLYVSNMFSSAGNRITHQEQFKVGLDEEEKQLFRRHARGNSLFEGHGNGLDFSDRSIELGVTLGRWAWASLFVDLNNDGWEDLYVTNGFITGDGGNEPDL